MPYKIQKLTIQQFILVIIVNFMLMELISYLLLLVSVRRPTST